MLENEALSTMMSFSKRRNNRKRTKVFDPCISSKKKKRSNEPCNENDSSAANDHFAIMKKHLLSSTKKDLNKTMDEMCNELGLNKYISEDDLSDEAESGSQDILGSHDSVKNCINKIFEGLDDYASFNPKGLGSTPKEQRKAYSAIDSSFKPTPGLTCISTRQKSILKPFSETNTISWSCGSVYKTPPSVENTNSYIRITNSIVKDSSRTPFVDKTNLFQTSVVRKSLSNNSLISPVKTPSHVDSTVQDPFQTPMRSSSQQTFRKLSPGVIELSPEVKITLLIGVACFVDVKTNKEDCSSSVALELLSMGATVEKTFNKKVNHVVFKEGRPSTFLKAKKLGVTMVSVLWLEACKRERKMVDPSLYPPVNVEKYESLSPNAKRIPTLKTIQRKLRKHLLREAGVLSADNKNKIRINWRNALTDIKTRSSSNQENSVGRLCTKKLDFNKPDLSNVSKKTVVTISDPSKSKLIDTDTEHTNRNSSSNSSSCQVSPVVERRNSAPAKFVCTRKKRKIKTEVCAGSESQKMLTIDQLFSKQMTLLNENKRIKLNCNDENGENVQSSQASRKKKLFNPEEVIAIIDSPEDKGTPPPVTYDFPYEDEENVPSKRKPHTKSTSMKKIFKKMIVSKRPVAKRSLTALLENDDASSSSSSRGSLTYFVNRKKTEPKIPKEPPTIVCTSLLPEEVRNVAYIAGKLGVFDVEDKVSSRTTHLVTSTNRRTINLLKALVRGAWILHDDWIHKSEEAGYWLNEEEFELKTFSNAVTEMRRERQAFGPEFCSELFLKCGPIYISKQSIPPHTDLIELVRLSKGRIVTNSNNAEFIIGGKVVEGETVLRLKEKWILDSISQNTLLDTERYVIKANKP